MKGVTLFRIILITSIFTFYLFAVDSNMVHTNIIDTTHNYISKKVEAISNFADSITDNTLEYTKNFTDDNGTNFKNVDALFQNERYIEEIKKSFVRLSMDYMYNSLDSNDINIKLTAKLALNKSRNNLRFYLSGLNQDNIDDINKKNNDNNDKAEIGISYLLESTSNLQTEYFLGIRSLYPYVKGRFSYTKEMNSWTIEPVQIIEYFTRDEFKEQTKLYLDTHIAKKVNLKLELSRGTNSKNSGMDYSGVASIFWTPLNKTGVQLSQGIYGNTKYDYIFNEVTGETKVYDKINNYETTLTFRQNIYKKWLFYEISPGINFHKDNDFKANYKFLLRIDAFFGDI